MQMTQEQSKVVGEYFELTDQECRWLETIPYRNPSNGTIPSDPLLYRLHEVRLKKKINSIFTFKLRITQLKFPTQTKIINIFYSRFLKKSINYRH